MSLLPPHAIDEFQALWKEHYGQELPREDAAQRAHQLFTLVRLLVQNPPSPKPLLPPTNSCPRDAIKPEASAEP